MWWEGQFPWQQSNASFPPPPANQLDLHCRAAVNEKVRTGLLCREEGCKSGRSEHLELHPEPTEQCYLSFGGLGLLALDGLEKIPS